MNRRMDFNMLTDVSTDIANLCFATREQKENIRENILLLVAAACRSYQADELFKRTVDTYSNVTTTKRRLNKSQMLKMPEQIRS